MPLKNIPIRLNAVIQELQPYGYRDFFFDWEGQGLVCLSPQGGNWAILTNNDDGGYRNRFCYNHLPDARIALTNWKAVDFTFEPEGWHRGLTVSHSGRAKIRKRDDNGVLFLTG